MVLRLAGELDLLPREQNALLEAAGLRPVFPQRSLQDSDMARFRQVIEALLEGHEPLPAAVIDRYGALRSANKAFERLTPGFVGLEPEELVDRFFGPGPLREAMVNWEEVASAWLARQRLEARRTADPRLEAHIARAEQLIGPLPPRIGLEEQPVVHSWITAGDDVLELFTVVVRFDTANDVTLSELRVELLYPGNEAADRFFGVAKPGT